MSLVKTHRILSVTSYSLSMLLLFYGLNIRRNATKASKIRALLKTSVVTDSCRQNCLDALEAKLVQSEEKRNRKNAPAAGEDEADDDDGQEEVPGIPICNIFLF